MLRAIRPASHGRSDERPRTPVQPAWFDRHVVPLLQALSRRACTHPIYTLVFAALMASTTYISLLESSLFDPPIPRSTIIGQLDVSSLTSGNKTLYAGPETSWRWQNGDQDTGENISKHRDLTLLTLVFPESTSQGANVLPPADAAIPMVNYSPVELLPSSKNILSPISQEKTLAISVPSNLVPEFLSSVRELPITTNKKVDDEDDLLDGEGKSWMMTATKGQSPDNSRSFRSRIGDRWTAFVDLLKNAEELDIIIMVLGYLTMHLTFASLFISLRRLGSRFWLGISVLFSSVFACLFGLSVTMRLGVPLNMVLLSEGLPFLVVIIGFEKPIILTKAVLSRSLALKNPSPGSADSPGGSRRGMVSADVHSVVHLAVRDCAYDIVWDYAFEILILVAGAASGVQGGLCQFCFLAAWILFFDCILLFTLYTAILTIKLEINRIKRHVTLRRALEEDGVSRRVAEEVASNEDWPRADAAGLDASPARKSGDRSIFGIKAGDSTVARFKFLMVAGFIVINLVNICSIPFRSGAKSAGSTLSTAVTQPPMDPFKVAGNALDSVLKSAKLQSLPTMVTILCPIKYELQYPSLHYSIPERSSSSVFDIDFADNLLVGVGGGVDTVLKSFEDPVLSKWVVAALVLSLILNGYLFNAARWSIKDPDSMNVEAIAQDERVEKMVSNGRAVEPEKHTTNQLAREGSAEQRDSDEGEDEGIVMKPRSKIPSRRTKEECEEILRNKRAPILEDEEIIDLALRGKIPNYALEKTLEDKTRAVKIRRAVVSRQPGLSKSVALLERSKLPFKDYHYDLVHGACCENVIGYMPLPLGVAGPMTIDGQSYYIPMATTEGVLVASTSRGCKAINAGNGAITRIVDDGMTRGPCVGFPTLAQAADAAKWLKSEEGFMTMKSAFDSTSRFARLASLKPAVSGKYLFIRFKTTTGDAMGMNMISKGVETALNVMEKEAGFTDMSIISVSGNFCTDKKPAAINWIDGRGKSVTAEAFIPGEVVRSVLKSDVNALVELNIAKNFIGSAMAGSVGGFNAHAANIVSAMFLATGQDPAQVVESSNCLTFMANDNGNLHISVSLPCIEVGTIGGGTFLPPQASMLDLLGVRGAHPTSPGDNSRQLARIIGAAVLAGELSLCAALAAGHLVRAHLQHNRSQVPTRSSTPAPLSPNGLMTSNSAR